MTSSTTEREKITERPLSLIKALGTSNLAWRGIKDFYQYSALCAFIVKLISTQETMSPRQRPLIGTLGDDGKTGKR